jgi:hypothetical protein
MDISLKNFFVCLCGDYFSLHSLAVCMLALSYRDVLKNDMDLFLR